MIDLLLSWLLVFIFGVPFVFVIIDSIFWAPKRRKIYEATELHQKKRDERYVKHFIAWFKEEIKKSKLKHNDVYVSKKDKEYPYLLCINDYTTNTKFRKLHDFRRHLKALKEGIQLGKYMESMKKKKGK